MSSVDRGRILNVADTLFNTRGYRNVTMADLAAQLGVSKKTLYLEFSGKAEIAEEIVEGMFDRITSAIDAANFDSQPLEQHKALVEEIKEAVAHMQPIFLRDIQKALPDLWDRIVQFRAGKIQAITQTALENAQKQGQLRALDTKLTASILLQTVEAVIQPEFLSQHHYSTREVMDALTDIFFHGLYSPNDTHREVGKEEA